MLKHLIVAATKKTDLLGKPFTDVEYKILREVPAPAAGEAGTEVEVWHGHEGFPPSAAAAEIRATLDAKIDAWQRDEEHQAHLSELAAADAAQKAVLDELNAKQAR